MKFGGSGKRCFGRFDTNARLEFLPSDAPVADFTYRRIPEQPAVLAAELRGAFIADTTAYGSDIFSVVSQDAPGFLETKLLLILQRTHACYLAEPLMKTGRAHT